MCPRTVIAILLIFLVSFPATSRTRTQAENEQVQQGEDSSLLPYDRYEAMEIARIFKLELDKGNDISPLIDKYFVSDFDERFAQEAAETFWFPAKPKALSKSNKEDSRRYYIALTNFGFLLTRLYCTLEKQEKERLVANGGPGDEEVQDVEKLFPKEIINAFRSSPYLYDLIPDGDKNAQQSTQESVVSPDTGATGEDKKESETEENLITTLEQLRDFSAALEIAAVRMRSFLNTLPENNTALDSLMPKEDDSEALLPSFDVSDNMYVTEEETFYGVSKGTRLICARVFNLHVDMIRVEGSLKVLSVYLQVSD